jgi:hypothetical protein
MWVKIPGGCDLTGDGSYEKPFRTVNRALELIPDAKYRLCVWETSRGRHGEGWPKKPDAFFEGSILED